jgi:hypothetical protein
VTTRVTASAPASRPRPPTLSLRSESAALALAQLCVMIKHPSEALPATKGAIA